MLLLIPPYRFRRYDERHSRYRAACACGRYRYRVLRFLRWLLSFSFSFIPPSHVVGRMDPFVLDRNFCKLTITCYGIKCKQYTGIYTKENSDGFRQNSTRESRKAITPQKSSQLILSRFSIEKHLLK